MLMKKLVTWKLQTKQWCQTDDNDDSDDDDEN